MQENRIELDRSGSGVAVLSVQGEHDVYTAPSLTEQVEGLIDERVPFVIDLTPATFVDSSVLRVLLEARRRAEEEGVGFAVALDQDDSGAVRRVLEVTGLIPVLPVHPARDAAMEAASTGHSAGMSAAVSLRLPARPENVAVVRQALTGPGRRVRPRPRAARGHQDRGHGGLQQRRPPRLSRDEDGLVEIEADSRRRAHAT